MSQMNKFKSQTAGPNKLIDFDFVGDRGVKKYNTSAINLNKKPHEINVNASELNAKNESHHEINYGDDKEGRSYISL